MENQLSFEQIDAQVNKLNLKDFESGGQHHFTAAEAANPAMASGVLQKVCSIYKGIRGIIVAISNFPLLPGTWRAAIKTFVTLMDGLCP